MYKIGEFAKITDTPIRTLRYYDDIGLLHPSYIDNFTGYRYYTNDDVVNLELIKLLKSVDFTLEEVKIYQNDLNKDALENKRLELLNNIDELKKKCKKILIMEDELSKIKTPKLLIKERKDENE